VFKYALSLLFTALLWLGVDAADQIQFSATTERTKVAMGEEVLVVATLLTPGQLSNLYIPQIPPDDAYTVIKTDSRQQSSIEIINGHRSRTITTQFYYSLAPRKTGTFTFPSISLTISGQTYTTNPITFTVTSEAVVNPDVRVILSLSRKELYPGEQALLTFKVAQRTQARNQSDVTKGFNDIVGRIDRAFGGNFALTRLFTNQVTSGSERIDGEMYNVYSLRYLLFPLSTGTYTIDAIPYDYNELRRSNRRRSMDPFDDFFGGDFFGGGMQAVGKTALTAPLTITVKQLPPPPPGFSGAVGSFSIAASASPLTVPAGESVTLKIAFKGSTRPGSMSDVTVAKGDAYELFTPEKQMSVDTTDAGIITRKTYKYLLIPRKEGDVTLPPVTFSYFDPAAGEYKTASSDPITLTVTKGSGVPQEQTRYLTQEEIREVGTDIRYIKTDVSLKPQTRYAYREPVFFLLFPVPFIIVLLSLLYRFQSERRDRTMAKNIRNKALATALRQLAQLRKQSSTVKSADLPGKMAAAIETYISQKFGLAATGRTLDELKEELSRSTADAATVNDLAAFIEKIDLFRFGGATLDTASGVALIAEAERFLTGLEKSAKKEKNIVNTGAVVVLLALAGATMLQGAPVEHWFDKGNRFYADGNFDSAAVMYEDIISAGTENSAVYFNYGNALFRLHKLGPARQAYERAALLDPTDADITANIKFIASNIVDRVPEPQRTFIDAAAWKLHTLFPLRTQLWIAFFLLLIISLAISFSLFSSRNVRLWLIYFSVLTGLLFCGVASSVVYKIYTTEKVAYAIVLSPAVEAKNEPKGSTVIFTAHEGTKFRIRKIVDKWALVSLPNGMSGWVEMKAVGKI